MTMTALLRFYHYEVLYGIPRLADCQIRVMAQAGNASALCAGHAIA
jgi:hypothetical protein